MVVRGSETLGFWRLGMSEGCRLCIAGLKVVVFISGGCSANCFYCPLSIERKRVGAFYVDEEPASSPLDVIDEISAVGARGISITGGEPMQVLDRVLEVVKLVRQVLGSYIHIHAYTCGLYATRSAIDLLNDAWIDELRFHPVDLGVWKLVEYAARETSMDVGVEVPALPIEPLLKAVVLEAWKRGAKFVNLNELEVSETNVDRLAVRGIEPSSDGRVARGSLDVALRVLEWADDEGLDIAIRVCTAKFKDCVQHARRLRRKALALAPPGARVGDDGVVEFEGVASYPTLRDLAPVVSVWRARRSMKG